MCKGLSYPSMLAVGVNRFVDVLRQRPLRHMMWVISPYLLLSKGVTQFCRSSRGVRRVL